MRRLTLVMMFVCSLVVVLHADAKTLGEKLYLVKLRNFDKNTTYKLMTPYVYKLEQSQLSQEKRFASKAMIIVKKAWKEDPDTAKKVFPRSAITPRMVTRMQIFYNREEAESNLVKCQHKALIKTLKKIPVIVPPSPLEAPIQRRRREKKEAMELAKIELATKARDLYEAALLQAIGESQMNLASEQY